VCNLYLKDQCRVSRTGTRNRQFIKQNLSMLVNAFYRCRIRSPHEPLNSGKERVNGSGFDKNIAD
jgi:hypothetical protein